MAQTPGCLLDLLVAQGGNTGIRLSFQANLVKPLQLADWPFHWAALNGDTTLAVFVYQHAPEPLRRSYMVQLPVAVFSASGLNGTTPWRKPLGVSPHEAALLAGHAATAQALQAMEQGVPLHWSPQRNAAYPAATRLKIRQLVQSLSLSSWFCCLPGPARQALVAAAASDIARTTAWPTLTAADWQAAAPLGTWQGPQALAADVAALVGAASPLGCGSGGRALPAGSPAEPLAGLPNGNELLPMAGPLPHVQFRMTQHCRCGLGGRRAWLGLLARGTLSLAVWALASRCKRDHLVLAGAYLVGALMTAAAAAAAADGRSCSCLTLLLVLLMVLPLPAVAAAAITLATAVSVLLNLTILAKALGRGSIWPVHPRSFPPHRPSASRHVIAARTRRAVRTRRKQRRTCRKLCDHDEYAREFVHIITHCAIALMSGPKAELRVDRSLQNNQFSSWRLGRDFLAGHQRSYELPGRVCACAPNDTVDYLHTRASVLHNHLMMSNDRLFCVVQEDQQLALLNVSAVHANNVAITKLASFPPPSSPPLAPSTLPLEVSVSVALPPHTPPAWVAPPPGSTPCRPDDSPRLPGDDTYDVLLSLGCGDLRLIRVQQGQLLWATAALHPLRPPPPLAGVRALKLETAFWSPTGELCCVVWAVGSKSSTQPAACQVYLITLACVPATPAAPATPPTSHPPASNGLHPPLTQPHTAPEPAPSLQATGVRLVGASCLPPHCTLPSPGGEAVVLGLDPLGCEGAGGELGGGPAASAPTVGGLPPAGAAGGASAGLGRAGQGRAGQGRACFDSLASIPWSVVDDEACMPVPCWVHGAWPCSADLDRSDMEEDDMDPRTLEAAAARLAQYTSDQPVGNLPLQQWADIYKETGAEEVCSDAGCDLVMLVTHSMQPETNAPPAAGGVDPSMGAQGEAGQSSRAAEGAVGTAAAARAAGAGAGGGGAAASQGSAGVQPVPLSCGPHKVLSADMPGLLAVTDDVDACVLQLGWQQEQQQEQQGTASLNSSTSNAVDSVSISGAGQMCSSSASSLAAAGGGPTPWVRHVATIPALAYIAAGKTQKKHLLVGDAGCRAAGVSAVLVEGAKFCYVYGVVGVRQEFGEQQVLDMQLSEGERVMGARLLSEYLPSSPVESDRQHQPSCSAAEQQGIARALLLVLTQHRLLVQMLSKR
ncbi:hypothetical protein QJQ45_027457 [Haematococcus lacustris]|nr:hypothetical protein QJQ45_027457 [Haematococcus lacustris]